MMRWYAKNSASSFHSTTGRLINQLGSTPGGAGTRARTVHLIGLAVGSAGQWRLRQSLHSLLFLGHQDVWAASRRHQPGGRRWLPRTPDKTTPSQASGVTCGGGSCSGWPRWAVLQLAGKKLHLDLGFNFIRIHKISPKADLSLSI